MTRSIDRDSAPEDAPGIQPPPKLTKQRSHNPGETCGGLPRLNQPNSNSDRS